MNKSYLLYIYNNVHKHENYEIKHRDDIHMIRNVNQELSAFFFKDTYCFLNFNFD